MAISEWVELLAKGVLIALLPLSLAWAQRGNDPLRRLAWVAVFFTFDLVLFGGFTRLTDSGLGCPDWPGCFAKSNPLAAAAAIAQAQDAMPAGPVTMGKAWIEMIHRFLAIAVGVVIVVMVVASWWQRRRTGRQPLLVSATLALVCLQGAFGAWTVTQKLQPAIVTTHLILGLTLLALLTLHALRMDGQVRPPAERPLSGAPPPVSGNALRWLGLVGFAVLGIQIALGGWVSTNYAVLACPDFPLCRGQWIPQMDLAAGFELWRELGRSGPNGYISTEALTAIHWVHRSFAIVVAIVLGALATALWRRAGEGRLAGWLLAGVALQVATGMGNVLLRWPLAIAVMHNGGAAALVMVLVMVNYRIAQSIPGPRYSVTAPRFAAT